MSIPKTLLFSFVASCCCHGYGEAATLASYFDGARLSGSTVRTSPNMAGDVPEGLTVGSLSFSGSGAGYGSSYYRNAFGNALPTDGNGNYWMVFSAAARLSGSFDLSTTDDTQSIQLESLTFDWMVSSSNTTSTMVLNHAFRIDLVCDGVTLENVFTHNGQVSLDALGQTAVQSFSVDLSAYSGQSIQVKFVDIGSIGGPASNGSIAHAMSNVRLNGNVVAIPEPSLALLGVAGFLAGAGRRRRNDK